MIGFVSGTSCDDGDKNTVDDACDKNGVCAGEDLCKDVKCNPVDDCHLAWQPHILHIAPCFRNGAKIWI